MTVATGAAQVLDELRALGTPRTAAIYRRHGARDEVYGVLHGELKKLQKRIKTDHDLARELWASGVHEARVLAMQIADPRRADAATIDGWARDLNDHTITDALSGFVARTPLARQKAEEWIESPNEWIAITTLFIA
jgi:3-methyladenine DNA glycosylase AlkD